MALKLASEDQDVEIPDVNRNDEIGEMAKAVQVFKTKSEELINLQEEQARKERDAVAERKAMMLGMAEDFENKVGNIVDEVQQSVLSLQETAQNMSSMAEETKSQASGVATSTDKAALNVNTVSVSAEELTTSIKEISRQVNEATKIATEAQERVAVSDKQISGLTTAAEKIGEVVELIRNIADQTNLLALNATIEAARAGEAGRGFAVVASEVKTLATETQKATEDITKQIENVQNETKVSVQSIQDIGEVVSKVTEISQGIAAAVEEQEVAVQEIARGAQYASNSTQEVAENIKTVDQVSAETGKTSSDVLNSAGDLNKKMTHLKSQLADFLSNIRSQ